MKVLDVSDIRIEIMTRLYGTKHMREDPEEYFKDTLFDSAIWSGNYDNPHKVIKDMQNYTLIEAETLAYLVLVEVGEIDAED